MIQLSKVSLAFGGQTVLDELTWTITADQQRIGLIGPNGAGKSTLLRLIAGHHHPDAGTVSVGGTTAIGYLEQDAQEVATERSVLDEALQAFDDVLSLRDEERRITQALEGEADHTTDRYQKLLHALERVQARLNARDAHRIRPKAEAVLAGLGFDPDDLDRPMHTFSGGWRMRVALAQLLLQQPDVLLLDEPTNHLDIESIDWLEGYLQRYRGTVVLVSHDRYFLDRMVTSIAELQHGQITEYAGNYSYYLDEREKRRALQQAAYDNQQREIAQIERFIDRFRYKASKAKQVQSRIKQLEKMERVPAPPSEEARITVRFPEPRRSGRVVLEVSPFSKTYEGEDGPIHVFDDTGPLDIERGDKIALIGKNGAGKSTLARILRGTEPFDGTRTLGYHVDLTFFAQHQADTLDPDQTVLESVRELAPSRDDTELRTMLGAFLFTGDDVFKRVRVLSGGEKSRVALARTLLHPANFLILDEPTNHLDIRSVNVLIEALQQYSGSFVIVSHDRHFLDQVATKVWHVGGGRVREFPGTYSEYRWYLQNDTTSRYGDLEPDEHSTPDEAEAQDDTTDRSGPKTRAQKRREAEERNRRYREMQRTGAFDYSALNPYKLRQHYEQTEAQILEKEERQAELEAQLADPTLYEDGDRAQQVNQAYEALNDELATLYERWEDIAEYLVEQKTE